VGGLLAKDNGVGSHRGCAAEDPEPCGNGLAGRQAGSCGGRGLLPRPRVAIAVVSSILGLGGLSGPDGPGGPSGPGAVILSG
jgi:hypothetical protein